MAGNTKAIVTLAVGGSFAARWHAVCEPLWRRYCDRHGYDLICLEEPLDTSHRARGRSPAWQKCLILGQPFAQDYEQVVWVDADILPNPEAPSIAEGVPVELVGAIDEYSVPTREIHAKTLATLYRHWDAMGIDFVHNLTPQEYYTAFGLPHGFDTVVQTGVMVLSPLHHRELLEETYARYDDRGPGWNYEMRPLSYELLRSESVTWLDPRFNYIWGHYQAVHFPFLLTGAASPDHAARRSPKVYFLHFTGTVGQMASAAARLDRVRRGRGRPVVPAAARARPARRTPVASARPRPARADQGAARARPRGARRRRFSSSPTAREEGDDDEAARCAETREIVAQTAFDCDVLTNYSAENLGVERRVESGLDWVFAAFPEAIVIEDDCHPHPSFFEYCDELLERYQQTIRG